MADPIWQSSPELAITSGFREKGGWETPKNSVILSSLKNCRAKHDMLEPSLFFRNWQLIFAL